ncbi:MAG: right-handed parallel beta-helix repeat-containing protein [Pseudomonadota bacterium]
MPRHWFWPGCSTLLCSLLCRPALADTLAVGPGGAFARPCAAVAAASDNDVIEIDAQGDYGGDVCQISKNGLTLRGVEGRAKIDAQGKNAGGKAIWVISGRDTTVENLEFSGASVPDQNGAGIRQEGDNLTVRGCYFHDNDDGILTGASPQSQILIEYSEFSQNGFGDGYSHNLYIGNVARFTLRYSYSHDSKVGHLVKSRAAENFITYNRLSSENGSTSYELDLPNLGLAVIVGNLIEQGEHGENPSLLSYGLEGSTPGNPKHELYVVNNTFVNDRPSGGTFVNIGAAVDVPAQLQNNIFAGPGTVSNQASAISTSNFSGGDPRFVDRATFDYSLEADSPCIDRGSAPGMADGLALSPEWQYLHPASARARKGMGIIDIGAYEYGTGNQAAAGAASGVAGAASGVAGAVNGISGAAGSEVATGGAASMPGGAANSDGGVGGSALGATPNAKHESGCSCRVSAGARDDALWLALLVSAAAPFRRRQRARQQAD